MVNEKDYCLCGSDDGGLLIECATCNQWYHVSCVALNGLDQKMVTALSNWECILCFKPSFCLPDDTTLKVVEKNILKVVETAVKETIENSDLCRKSEVEKIVKENASKAIKTYSEATASSQKKVLDEMSAIQASKSVIEEVTRKLDTDKVEREKRRSNVCVLGIKESTRDSANLRNGDDYRFCVEELGIERKDIDSCFRAGIKNSDPNYCRPLIVKMVDQAAADYWTNYGRGWKTNHQLDSGKFVYLNPDLCKADRNANFLAREERRKRMIENQENQRQRQSSAAPM